MQVMMTMARLSSALQRQNSLPRILSVSERRNKHKRGPEGDADNHEEAGDEKENSRGTKLHVLLEDLPKSEEVQGVPRNEDVRGLNFKDLVDFDY